MTSDLVIDTIVLSPVTVEPPVTSPNLTSATVDLPIETVKSDIPEVKPFAVSDALTLEPTVMNPEILAAYDFTGPVNSKVEANLASMGTFPYIKHAVESDRSVETINGIAHKIGMCIPQNLQKGDLAYSYFIANASKYERVLAGVPRDFPSLESIFLKTNYTDYISQFQDDYLVSASPDIHTSRENLIVQFIEENIYSVGRFTLPIDTLSVYKNSKTECFVYQASGQVEVQMSMDGIRDGINKKQFSELTLMHLRQTLLEKVHFWTQTTSKKIKVNAVELFIKSLDKALESKKDIFIELY